MIEEYSYDIGRATDVGNVRTVNQDSLLVRCGSFRKRLYGLLVVADGMGGMQFGERASGEVVRAFYQWWNEDFPNYREEELVWEKVSEALDRVLRTADENIREYSAREEVKSGTTVSLAFLVDQYYMVKQCGDSRVYLAGRDGLQQITKDHTWVQREVDAGNLTEEEALVHRMRHVLTNAVGAGRELRIDTFGGELSEGESLLLCSDGFYDYLDDTDVGILCTASPAQTKLIAVTDHIKEKDATDNLTAVLLTLGRDERPKTKTLELEPGS
ncbi:MAG: serine/threonine-protein phosphatase [Clostridium sp.]|nr:serine/threonine-protein phosphatase [Clostridium sp.]